MPYTRTCPQCGKTLSYSTEGNRDKVEKRSSACRTCTVRGRRLSDETRKKMSTSRAGCTLSEEHRRRIGEGQLGRVLPQAHRKKISDTKARRPWAASQAQRKRMSDARKGAAHSEETIRKISLAHGGTGVPGELELLRGDVRPGSWWRAAVLDRDNHKCAVCGTPDNLHAHHVLSVSRHPELAAKVNNGVALCQKHHIEHHRVNGVQ